MMTDKKDANAAVEAVLAACRQEFNERGYKGDLERLVKGDYRDGTFYLQINQISLGSQKIDLPDNFNRFGAYAVCVPEGEPDIVHAKAENHHLHTQNFAALRDGLNKTLLSEKNQITFGLNS